MFFYTLKNIFQYNFFHNSLYFIQLKHSDKSTEFTRLLKESMAQKKVKNLCKLCNFTSQFLWMHYIHRKFKTGQKIHSWFWERRVAMMERTEKASGVPVISHFLIQGIVTQVCLFCEDSWNCTLTILCVSLYAWYILRKLFKSIFR